MTPNLLLEQQRALMRAIVDGAPHAGLRPRPSGQPALLPVYRQAYTARLAAALADNYLVLQRAMGDAAFDALACAYIGACPSRRPSIRWFGDRLPAFMAGRGDLVPHPALADIARMDWALRSAFDAADAPVLEPQDAARVPAEAWPGLTMQLHPSVQTLALQWNVEPVWQALRAHEPGSGAAEPELPEPQVHAHHLLVWRQQLDTRWRSLDAREAALLGAVQRGCRFDALCEQALEAEAGEDAAVHVVVQAVQQWLSEGLLSHWSAV